MTTAIIRWPLQTAILVLGLAAAPAAAIESPGELLALKLNNPMFTESQGTMTGEGVAWHASWRAADFVSFARQTGETAYLDAAVTYFDSLRGRMHTSPDGWKGWVGPYIYDTSVIGDVHIGDAILINHMLAFALYLDELPAAEAESYRQKAAEYVDLARHIADKWDARGTWYESGHTGGYVSWDHYLTPDGMDAFLRREGVRNSGLSLPFNKQQSMAILHLRLHRLTGNDEDRRRARLIFQTTKSRLSAFGDTYTWNYWEPFTPDDVVSVEPPKLAHWVATHPFRNYQAGEVDEFVEAYERGLVFTRSDMEALVRTNRAMWNGDVDEPQWTNSDLRANRAAVPGWTPLDPAAHGYPQSAGTLWRALVPFDPTLATLAGAQATNPEYERDPGVEVQVMHAPPPQVVYLNLGCVLPPVVSLGESAYLVSKARADGHLRILLVDADGGEQVLFEGDVAGGLDGVEGLTVRHWTADAAPGDYRVRWEFRVGEHRESRAYPLTVK